MNVSSLGRGIANMDNHERIPIFAYKEKGHSCEDGHNVCPGATTLKEGEHKL